MNDLYRLKANSSRLCEVFCIQTRISEKASMSLLKDGSKIWSFIGGTATLKIRDYQCSTYKWKDKAKLLKHGQKGGKGSMWWWEELKKQTQTRASDVIAGVQSWQLSQLSRRKGSEERPASCLSYYPEEKTPHLLATNARNACTNVSLYTCVPSREREF